MKRAWVILAAVAAWSASASAQGSDSTTPPHGWEFAAQAYVYMVPDAGDFLMPLVYADRQKLHLEARYNYEAQETGSFWAGYRLEAEGKVSWEFIPMVGGVVGELDGMAPGFEVTAGIEKFELYSEGELFFDFEDTAGDFFYSWTEVYYMPSERFRFGLVGQRTRSYETEVEVNRGVLAGATAGRFEGAVYMLNLGWDEPTWIVAASVNF